MAEIILTGAGEDARMAPDMDEQFHDIVSGAFGNAALTPLLPGEFNTNAAKVLYGCDGINDESDHDGGAY